jgi:hypothetical protein
MEDYFKEKNIEVTVFRRLPSYGGENLRQMYLFSKRLHHIRDVPLKCTYPTNRTNMV